MTEQLTALFATAFAWLQFATEQASTTTLVWWPYVSWRPFLLVD